MENEIKNAVKLHAEGMIEKHRINALNLMKNPVGIGEHGDIVEEIQKELDNIAKYHDYLEILGVYFEEWH